MSTENPDEKLDEVSESSTETTQDENISTESSTVEGEGAEGSPAPESTKTDDAEKSARAALIKQLTGEGDEETDPETEVVTAEAGKTKEGEVETPAAKKDDPEKPAKPDEADDDDTPPEGTKGKQARKWQALLDQRKALKAERDSMKAHADYGKSLLDVAAEAKMPPEAFGAWIALGAEIHRDGPQKLPLRLMAEAKRLATAYKVELPVDRVVEKSAFDLEAFEAKLIDDIADMAIDPALGKKYLADIRAAKKQTPVQTPAPAAPAPAPQSTFVQQSAPTPTPPVHDPDRDAAVAELDRLQAEYAKQMPADWQKIRPKVVEAMVQYKGTSPKHWGRFFKQEVENVKRALGARKPAAITTTTRPSANQTTAKPKSGREEILKELTG